MSSTPLRGGRRAIIPLTIATALALSACAGTETPAASDGDFTGVDLTVWNIIPYDPYDTLQKGYFAECATELGITLTQETIPTDYQAKLLQAASSNTFPDIALVDSDVSFPQLASSGVLADLGKLGITTEGQSEAVAALGDYDGTLYGLPTQVEDYALWYDKAAFAEAGIEEFPTTFDGLVDAAAKLTKEGRDGISLAGKNDGSTPVYFLPFLLSSGADPADPSTAEAAIGLYKDLYDAGSLNKEFVNRGWEAPDVWKEGKAAITVTGPWELVSGLEIDYGVAPFPTVTEGESPRVGLLGYEYVLKAQKDDKRAQAAAALLQCRAAEANQIETAIQGGYIPALTSAQDAFVAEVPAAAGFVDQVAGAYNNAELGTEWSALQQVYVAAIQYATVEGLSPKDALAKAAQD